MSTSKGRCCWHPPEVESKLERKPEEYLKERLQYKINSYVHKGRNFRVIYWVMASFAAVGSVTVPALINIGNMPDWIPTVISLCVAAVVALEGIFHPRELWRNYDLIAAGLREEEMRFSTKSEPYDKSSDPFHLLVKNVEDRIKEERLDTIGLRTTPPSEDG
jgi:hypothetical protein